MATTFLIKRSLPLDRGACRGCGASLFWATTIAGRKTPLDAVIQADFALGCDALVPADRLMCRRHWMKVPPPLADEVWATYRAQPGSREHRSAIVAAQRAVADLEGRTS